LPSGVDALLRPSFLTAAECGALRAEMDQAPTLDGGVREAEQPDADTVDRGGRNAIECLVSAETTRGVADRILGLVPQLAEHFHQELGQYEAPHFVAYEPGGFYRPHRDRYPDVELPDPLVRRRLSLVVFLNEPGDPTAPERPADAPGYRGGTLRLSSPEADDFDDPRAWDVPAAQGLLVAFRADAWHEVTTVTAGRRYTIVAILLAPRR
jgi:predicted 2-oxoglutarate/Fe(II)-dependent dioxygenase YbiX